MVKLRGATVILIDKVKKGEDDFGQPIFEDKEIKVDNVLISPLKSEEVLNSQNLSGRIGVYQLAIPKNDLNKWEDREVIFFGKRWRVFGAVLEGIDSLIPLDWNKKVTVEAYE